LRPIQRDQSNVAFGCEADVLVVHATSLNSSLRLASEVSSFAGPELLPGASSSIQVWKTLT
jgi:hypothetical protein